jgi:hypothetical protein
MWKSAGRAPSLRVFPGICLTTEEKARENLSQGKKNLSQVKKNLSQSAVYTFPKHPHITKPSQTQISSDVCWKFGVVNFTIQTLWKNKTEIIGAFEQVGSRIKRFRKPERSDVDEALLKWLQQQRGDAGTLGQWSSSPDSFCCSYLSPVLRQLSPSSGTQTPFLSV